MLDEICQGNVGLASSCHQVKLMLHSVMLFVLLVNSPNKITATIFVKYLTLLQGFYVFVFLKNHFVLHINSQNFQKLKQGRLADNARLYKQCINLSHSDCMKESVFCHMGSKEFAILIIKINLVASWFKCYVIPCLIHHLR